jgi:transcription elongation factor Elf1
MSSYKQPEFLKSSFTCPHCGTIAEMYWTRVKSSKGFRIGNALSYEFQSQTIAVSQCRDCEKFSVWIDKAMVYPEACGAEPHDDMPEQAKKTFREAQSILGKSPRGACMMLRLCVEQLLTELGYEQKNLADKIKAAAPEGSNLHLILDACRLAGNEFVHAGTIEELDKSGHQPEVIAEALSTFINQAVLQLVTIPKAANAIKNRFKPQPKSAK